MRDQHVGAGLGHRLRAVAVEDVRARQQIEPCAPRAPSRPRGRSSCRSPRGSARKTPSIRPTVGKFWMPSKPIAFSSRSRTGMMRNGSVPQTPASTGVSLHDRQHLLRHVLDDRVGVAVGQQAGEAAAPGHPVAAGVVDDDQVDAAALGELGRDAGAGAGADDRLVLPYTFTEARQRGLVVEMKGIGRSGVLGSERGRQHREHLADERVREQRDR